MDRVADRVDGPYAGARRMGALEFTHHELPGERERLDAYLRECGIER